MALSRSPYPCGEFRDGGVPLPLHLLRMESHDLPVDAFATPSGLVHCNRIASKPSGIRHSSPGCHTVQPNCLATGFRSVPWPGGT